MSSCTYTLLIFQGVRSVVCCPTVCRGGHPRQGGAGIAKGKTKSTRSGLLGLIY